MLSFSTLILFSTSVKLRPVERREQTHQWNYDEHNLCFHLTSRGAWYCLQRSFKGECQWQHNCWTEYLSLFSWTLEISFLVLSFSTLIVFSISVKLRPVNILIKALWNHEFVWCLFVPKASSRLVFSADSLFGCNVSHWLRNHCIKTCPCCFVVLSSLPSCSSHLRWCLLETEVRGKVESWF